MNINQHNQNGSNGNHTTKNRSPLTKLLQNPFHNSSISSLGDSGANFEQKVVLRQSPLLPRLIIGTIVGVTTGVVLWAAFAPIEQVVTAQGQLKPNGKVKEIQAPVNGVIEKVHVEDGERVKEGQLLVTFDSTSSIAELKSLQNIRQSLQQENRFYRALMSSPMTNSQMEQEIARLGLPAESASLARNRTSLVAENQLFTAQLGVFPTRGNLDAAQIARLRAAQSELNSRANAARLEVLQLEQQLKQNEVQLADARAKLRTAQIVLQQIQQRNQQTLAEKQKGLEIDQEILKSIQDATKEGAIGRLQMEKQKQAVSDRQGDLAEKLATGQIDYDRQNQEVKTAIADIERFQEEKSRLMFNIAQAREKLSNTTSLTEKDVLDQIATNEKRIAEIDSQLTKIIVENDKQIAENESKISNIQVTLKYQEIKAPVSGTVFDLQAGRGFVPKSGQAEALLKIVPDDTLIAEVFITNKNIGFVAPDQPADIRIDSFPFSEFGDIKGKVISIGSDALKPDETYKFYRFPAKISLDRQYIATKKGKKMNLQSGMSISVNIKVDENRTVLSLFTELFTKKVESLKQVY